MLDALVYIIQAIVGFITALVLLFIDASIPNVKNILCFPGLPHNRNRVCLPR